MLENFISNLPLFSLLLTLLVAYRVEEIRRMILEDRRK